MSDGEVRMRVPFSECEGVGVMSTVSRRKFFGLVGGAAAVATLPRQVLAVMAPAADWDSPALLVEVSPLATIPVEGSMVRLDKMFFLFTRYLSDDGKVLSENCRELSREQVARQWGTIGLFDRSAKP